MSERSTTSPVSPDVISSWFRRMPTGGGTVYSKQGGENGNQ